MASAGKPALDDSRRATGSPKLKGRGMLDLTLSAYLICVMRTRECANEAFPGTCWSRAFADDEVENAKDTLCRNVTIYGRCRYEDKGIYTTIRTLFTAYLQGV